jgi:peptidoglycan/xylan/chitin deacetylase (PgdA/CDA1 family)
MIRALAALRRPASFLLVPLSVVPLIAVIPILSDSKQSFERTHESAPLPALQVRFSPQQQRRFQPMPALHGAVPVLAYHGINGNRDRYSVSRAAFAAHMALLKRLGFQTISITDYARFYRGEPVDLPPRPILITFDDGRLDSYRGADEVLARDGFQATMFVITGEIERGNPFYLTWRELHRMADSGRWQIQPHAHNGHRRISATADGRTGPYYAVRWYTRSDGEESVADYERRVSRDVYEAVDTLEHQGFPPVAFSVPFGDDGHSRESDPHAAPFLDALLRRQFEVTFVQHPDNDPSFTRPHARAERYEVRTGTTTDQLYDWLHTQQRRH